jgi:hypothetical protein
MERKDFLKSACKYGICGCFGMSFLTDSSLLANSNDDQKEKEPDWRIDFMQNRYKDLLYILNDTIDEKTYIKVLNQLGA